MYGQQESSHLTAVHQRITKTKTMGLLSEAEAAITIQRAWRRHIVSWHKKALIDIFFLICDFKLNIFFSHFYSLQDVQVYRYYRDLISFQSRGDPAVMLRCINPNEAKLLDSASGASVRFRLAGVCALNYLAICEILSAMHYCLHGIYLSHSKT